ncbi:peptidyl-prolyl cis-trans isomerase CYP59 isoform X1 [Eucalyptus grandis]|uniref:peptidyl-prolyl cis-trans isomerase CYP59 isoform X1 n=1 Tax=Eucalyptus grandis TaxID=71139 RepID=UPI00192EB359|nr:peptidyl-prolyl cis-trans isomerase CYP59 isoform X1 [Eucalyptus grandis]
MSVLLVTSLGDIVVDLHADRCPLTCKNFLKLCRIKYYNGCVFHTVQKDFTAQTGDPTGTGTGGDSVYKFLYGDQARFFMDEIHLDLKHSKTGTVAMASGGENLNASQFYFTLRDDLDYLDGKHTVFGEVAEGLETLTRINEAYVDEKGRPYKNIRIRHTYILDDPFDDPPQLAELIPDASPEGKPKDEVVNDVRLEDDWVPMDEQLGPAQLEEAIRAKEAHSRAVVLESIGDIPDAEIKPPDNVLFVCKLNPVTEDEDLHTIFSRFGTVVSADVIRDFKTGDSLCYAFIEFENKDSCEQAYFKMDNALIDDRRIKVDFSQSVAKLWSQFKRKDSQAAKGKGCFKCGAPDHMARECPGSSTRQPLSKYILKEDNAQRGGDDSRYEMVFDEDAPESPSLGKKRRGRDDRDDRHKMSRQSVEETKFNDREGGHSVDKHRQSERSKHREDEMSRDSKASEAGRRRIDRDFPEEERDGEKYTESHRDRDGKRGDYRDYRKGRADVQTHGDRRGDENYRRKSAAYDDGHEGGGAARRKDSNDDHHAYRRGYGESRKGTRDEDDDGRGRRDDPSYRRSSGHKDSSNGGREEQKYRSGETDGKSHRDRSHRGDRRR